MVELNGVKVALVGDGRPSLNFGPSACKTLNKALCIARFRDLMKEGRKIHLFNTFYPQILLLLVKFQSCHDFFEFKVLFRVTQAI